jgi:hypothetical protein
MKMHIRTLVALALTLPAWLQAATTLRVSTPQLKPESQIEIIFDRSVVTDKAVNQMAANNILKIKPVIKGKIHWRATNIARFVPSEAPKMGTTYEFSIAKGHTFHNGTELPAIKLKTIASEPFRVQGSSRRSKSNSYTRQPSYTSTSTTAPM